MKTPEIAICEEKAVIAPVANEERRRSQRDKIANPARVRPWGPKYEEEVRTTLNSSRDGLYFTTWSEHYHLNMSVSVIFPYASVVLSHSEHFGRIVRIERLTDGRLGIAVQFLSR
jgi:hypothetical protein